MPAESGVPYLPTQSSYNICGPSVYYVYYVSRSAGAVPYLVLIVIGTAKFESH